MYLGVVGSKLKLLSVWISWLIVQEQWISDIIADTADET